MSYIDELRELEKQQEKRAEEEKEKHKCHGCEWGAWQGNKRYCMFPRCIKEELKRKQ
jgi:hypothetical protein